MPLKEIDLKNIETYKKALRLDLPKLTSGNAKFWIYKDVELPDATGKKQKLQSFLALVEDTGIKKLVAGKQPLCKGLCHMEEGKVAFEPQTGKVPYNLLKTSLPLFLGKPVLIPTNVVERREDEAGEKETEEAGNSEAAAKASKASTPSTAPTTSTPSTSPPQIPQRLATTQQVPAWLTKDYNTLLTWVQSYTAAHPERKDELTRALAGIAELVEANKADEARQRMAQVRAAMNAPTDQPLPPPPPPLDLTGAWAKMQKDAGAFVAAHPEQKDALMRAGAGITDLLKANQTAAAKQKMDQVQAILNTSPAAKPSGAAAELTARWNALVKEMQAAIAAHPEKKADIARASAGIPDMLRAGKLELAKKLMDTVDKVLGVNPQEKEFDTRYKALEAQLAAALKDPSRDASRLRAISAFAAEKAGAGDFDAALKALSQLKEVLGSAPATAEPAAKEDPRKTGFERRFAALDERVQKALKERVGDASQIRSAIAFASEKGEAGDYEAALAALDRLEKALDAAVEPGARGRAAEPGVPYKGIAAYRKSLLEFDKAKKAVNAQLDALSKAMKARSSDLEDLAGALEEELGDLNGEIGDAIDEAMSAAENQASPITDAVKMKIQKYLTEVRSNPLVKRADSNPFGAAVSIEKTLTAALQNIRQALPVRG